ncbi:TPA: hypothetical protein RZC51_001531 [Burkholderia cenocepacia]|nr:hypothetical protein [Burkholderia cenocepacia]
MWTPKREDLAIELCGEIGDEYIRHALKFLKPGGLLVAICANGPRQAEQLRSLAEDSGRLWEPLPLGTFNESSTDVRAVLLTIER